LAEWRIAPSFQNAGGTRWTTKLGQVESYDSDEAVSVLGVPRDSKDQGSADDLGDLGPMWTIENEEGEVTGACWSYYNNPGLECIPL